MQCAFYCDVTINFLENYKSQLMYKDTLSNKITKIAKYLKIHVAVVTSWKTFLLE
jgi:hypothetical protein